MANIGEQCDIGGASVRDMMDVFSRLQGFIHDYFLEDHHVLDALLTMDAQRNVERVDIYKEMTVDGFGFVNIIPKIIIVPGDGLLLDAPVALVEQLVISDFSGAMEDRTLNSKFTLLEVMEGFFSELGPMLIAGR